jgi:predicted DNA-binding WGR domain protein
MKLVKQSKLYFKEGNSDKAYEIDLCEVGNDLFVVNFRFGKRGAALKDGTKTDSAVNLISAEKIFDALEAEKRKKGYQSEDEVFTPLPKVEESDLSNTNLNNAILKRLNGFIEGKSPFKTAWSASRVIWKAGELKMVEANPFIIRLIDAGDEMQRYAAIWALGRIADPASERILTIYYTNQKYTEKTRRIAGEALVQVLKGDAQKLHLQNYHNRLTEDFKNALNNVIDLRSALERNLSNTNQTDFGFLLDLYILSVDNQIIRKEIIQVLRTITLKAGYFKPIRHILKIAELRDDFEILGVLSYRFERTLEMYKTPRNYYSDENREYAQYVHAIGKSIKIKAELKKSTSQIAYSDQTRAYLTRKSLRSLKELGQTESLDYIKLAMSILLSYDSTTDYQAAYSRTEYSSSYVNGNYSWTEVRIDHPAYSNAVLMNLILHGGGNLLTFKGKSWQKTETEVIHSNQSSSNQPVIQAQNDAPGVLNKVFDSIFSLFSKKEEPKTITPAIQTETPEEEPILVEVSQPFNPKRHELYPNLWDKVPQAYVQLLLQAKVDEIHTFAFENLTSHTEYQAIKDKINIELIEQLLASDYSLPAEFGLGLVKEKLTANPDKNLILALIKSKLQEARNLGLSFIDRNIDAYFDETKFITNMLFSKFEDIRHWTKEQMAIQKIEPTKQQLLVARSLAEIQILNQNSIENNAIINDVSQTLLINCPDALAALSNQVLNDLLAVPIEATQVFAVRIIILKNTELPAETLCSLLASEFEQVRKAGSELLTDLKPKIDKNPAYAQSLVEALVPLLLRKEPYLGLHEDVSSILRNQLGEHLQTIDSTTTNRLIHSNYRPAQDLGLVLLQNYADKNAFSMRDIIHFGNHELLVYRNWCWQYFNENLARIKYESDESIRLLDAKWDDTRAFAITFFRTNFSHEDWSPEVLIGIVDSVRPDIEAFGRELITKYFEEGKGEEYLLKLSQHPSIGVQLFATNYLERFAANDTQKLQKLIFYFRSVLTRVNKGRIAKGRIFAFLHQESKISIESARIVSAILRDVSATVSIEDKAKCIAIMQDLKARYEELNLPIRVMEFETR